MFDRLIAADPANLRYRSAAAEAMLSMRQSALALRFADRHAANLRYVAPHARWLLWNGQKWGADDTLLAFSHARSIWPTPPATELPAR